MTKGWADAIDLTLLRRYYGLTYKLAWHKLCMIAVERSTEEKLQICAHLNHEGVGFVTF